MWTILDAPAATGHLVAQRCLKCPRERQPGEPGWYFVDLDEVQRLLGPCRLYVCPDDYLKFATSERGRWEPLADGSHPNGGGELHNGDDAAPQNGGSCSVDALITLLEGRGLAGWVFFVRDVAAGRVRRVHLRQLPAEPEIRRALVEYLHQAGTVVTVSRTLLEQQRRSARV